jgi:SAM-dependent methyltransferase
VQRFGQLATHAGLRHAERLRRFDRWAASYDHSQLQTVLFEPVHDAVLRYVWRQVGAPRWILDVGCGTGRLTARLTSACPQAHVVGIDACTAMIENAVTAPVPHQAHFATAVAERLPFADAIFDLVLVTLSVSHWHDKLAGLAEISRVMAADATLVAADVCPAQPFRPVIARPRRSRPGRPPGLPCLIAASGLRIEHLEPIRSVALIADAALVAAKKPWPVPAITREAGQRVTAGPGQVGWARILPRRPRPAAAAGR